MFERYSFVTITTADLKRAHRFWVDQLGLLVTEEKTGEYFIVDVGGLRLCVDVRTTSGDPTIGLKVGDLSAVLDSLRTPGLMSASGPTEASRGAFATFRGARRLQLEVSRLFTTK